MQNVHETNLLDASRENGVELGTILHAHLSPEGRIALVDTLLTRISEKTYPIAGQLFKNFDYGMLEGMLNEIDRKKG